MATNIREDICSHDINNDFILSSDVIEDSTNAIRPILVLYNIYDKIVDDRKPPSSILISVLGILK